jgi:GT2 family glycosyltransferase
MISIITPTIRPDQLQRLKASIKKQAFSNYEHIIQVDKKHEGAAITRNKALKKAKGKYIAFIDDDCEADEFWLGDLHEYLENNPHFAGVSGLVFPPKDASTLQRAIYYLPMNDEYTSEILDQGIVNVNHLSCTNALWRKEVIDDLNGFDETLKRAQDLDLGLRAVQNGYILKAIKGGTVYHHYRSTLKEFLKQSYVQGKGGGLLMKKQPDYFGKRTLLIKLYPLFLFCCLLFPPLLLLPLIMCRSGFKAFKRTRSIKLFFTTTFLEWIKYYFNLAGIWREYYG